VFSRKLLDRLTSANAVAVLTGAGISAESGVPTFWGNEGLWTKFKPEELANFDAFIKNPDLVWEWYAYRKKLIAEVKPNPGHYALAQMEKLFQEFAVITQNIDNLHQRAGSRRVYELHGNIERNYCINCGRRYRNDELVLAASAPRCVDCNELIRPDVVWFGEVLPTDQWESADRASRNADVFFSIGTSAIVYPAASLPLMAKESGAYVVEINAEVTPLSDTANESLIGKAGEILPRLVKTLRERQGDENQKPICF
jgi:NAD-dependent deacetylase